MDEEDKISASGSNSDKPPFLPDEQKEPNAGDAGEFTRMFQSPSPSTPASPVAPAPAATPTEASGVTAGEFTKFFETPRAPASPVHAPVTSRQPMSDTEKWLQSLESENPNPAEPPLSIAPPSSPLASNIPGGPSEFTIITEGLSKKGAVRSAPAVSTSAPPDQESALPIPSATPPALIPPVVLVPPAPSIPSGTTAGEERQRASYMPLIIIFNVLFLLAILLVLFFVLRR